MCQRRSTLGRSSYTVRLRVQSVVVRWHAQDEQDIRHPGFWKACVAV